MGDILYYVFLLALLALAALAVYWVVKSYLNGQSPTAAIFGPRPERRLAVVEHANVDGRRRLILIRRDGTEHLIMTGGPVDVVIETGIQNEPKPIEPVLEAPATAQRSIFTRPLRVFGQPADRAPERAAE